MNSHSHVPTRGNVLFKTFQIKTTEKRKRRRQGEQLRGMKHPQLAKEVRANPNKNVLRWHTISPHATHTTHAIHATHAIHDTQTASHRRSACLGLVRLLVALRRPFVLLQHDKECCRIVPLQRPGGGPWAVGPMVDAPRLTNHGDVRFLLVPV